MSQMIACRSPRGIVLGTDAHSIEIDDQGAWHESQVQRLYQLSPHAVLMVGGGTAGAAMGASLQSFMARERFGSVEDVYTAALPYLASEYETYMQRHCDRLPIDPIHHIYFVLAGHSPHDPAVPFQAYLIWTKRQRPLLDGETILSAYAVPRLIQIEAQLNRMSQENHRLEEIQAVIQRQIQRGAQMENRKAIAAYALITTDGVRMVTDTKA